MRFKVLQSMIGSRKFLSTVARRHIALTVLLTLSALTVVLSLVLPGRYVVLNVSPSVAPGLYVAIDKPPRRGSLIEFHVPRVMGDSVFARTSRGKNTITVLKHVLATEGDHIDTTGPFLRINGAVIALIQTHDSKSRPMPIWRADRALEADEFFVFSGRVWNSFDSRYFGPILYRDIVAVRKSLITWGEPR